MEYERLVTGKPLLHWMYSYWKFVHLSEIRSWSFLRVIGRPWRSFLRASPTLLSVWEVGVVLLLYGIDGMVEFVVKSVSWEVAKRRSK